VPTSLPTYVVPNLKNAEFKYPINETNFTMTMDERQWRAFLEATRQQADQVPVQPKERMMKNREEEKEKEKEKKKEKKKKKVASISMNVQGATIGTITGGTVQANTNACTRDLFVQNGENSQQKFGRKNRRLESESEDEDSFTDSDSD
jgi:hypothetical protein